MDPIRIVLRATFAYAYLLLVVRSSGKHIVAQGNAVEFVLALVFADLIDDAIWSEVPLSRFVVASATMFAMRRLLASAKGRAMSRVREE